MLLRTFSTDILKAKNTFALWLTILGAGFVPAIMFLIVYNRPIVLTLKTGNAWHQYFELAYRSSVPFFLPLFVVLIVSLVVQTEHKSNTWKHLLTLPVPKHEIYISKILLILSLLILCYLLFVIFLLAGGVLLGLIHPQLKLLSQVPDFEFIAKMGVKLWVSALAIVAIHYWLCIRVKNQILPIGIGLVGIISTLILGLFWKNIVYFPWAFLMLTNEYKAQAGFLLNHELRSILYFVVIACLGYFDFSKWYKA